MGKEESMKLRSLLVMVVCLGMSSLALASEASDLMTNSATCPTNGGTLWFELSPGDTWSRTLDLSGCSDEQMGWFYYYGVINKNNRSPLLKVRDGIDLQVNSLDTEAKYVCTNGNGDMEAVLMELTHKGTYELSAFNSTKKTARIRIVWDDVTR